MTAARITRATLVAAVGVALAGGVAGAASQLRPTPQPRLTLDARGPLVDVANLLPGTRVDACARVVNRGDAAGRVALHAPAVRGGLAQHLELTVVRAKGCMSPAGAVLFRGRLADFPSSAATAVSEAVALEPGAARAFHLTLALADDAGAEGLDARWDWRVAVEATGRTTRCARVQASRRVRTVRLRPRGRVVVRLRVVRGRLQVRSGRGRAVRATVPVKALRLGVRRVGFPVGSRRASVALRVTAVGGGTCVVS
jgi:hypothetical protein